MPAMQIKLLFRLALTILPISAIAQSSNIRIGSKEYQLLDRLEIKTRSSFLTQSFAKPYNRINVLRVLDSIVAFQPSSLTHNDQIEVKRLLHDPENSSLSNGMFYSTKNSGFQLQHNKNYLLINPIIRTDFSRGKNTAQHPHLFSFGVDSRGILLNKIGFSFYATHNNERFPLYLNDWFSIENKLFNFSNCKFTS